MLAKQLASHMTVAPSLSGDSTAVSVSYSTAVSVTDHGNAHTHKLSAFQQSFQPTRPSAPSTANRHHTAPDEKRSGNATLVGMVKSSPWPGR